MPSKRLSDFQNPEQAQDWLLKFGIFLPLPELEKRFAGLEKGQDTHFRVIRKRRDWRLKITHRDVRTNAYVFLSERAGVPLHEQMTRATSYAKGRNLKIVDYSAERAFLDKWIENPDGTRIMMVWSPDVVPNFTATKNRLAESDRWLLVFRKKEAE